MSAATVTQLCRRSGAQTVLRFDAQRRTFAPAPTTNVSQSRPPRTLATAWTHVQRVYLPEEYPASVGANFGRYAAWLLVQNSVGSAAYVLSTNALLTSLGVGAAAAVPLAATINWVLKDGLGSLGMIAFAARGGGARFDGDAKVTKWRADVLFNVGVLLELLTPLVPAFFLPLASLANLAKGVGGLAAGASKATLHRSLALRDNLGDVTAKLYSQGITAYLLGMGLGIATTVVCHQSQLAVAAAFGALTAVHLAASHRALRCLELRSLNAHRLRLLALHWRRTRTVASPADVARLEPIVWRRARDAVRVAPSLAALGDAPPPEHWRAHRSAVLPASRTLLFRHDHTADDVIEAFYRVDGDEQADARAFVAALRSDTSGWNLALDLIRIENTISSESSDDSLRKF